MMMFVTENTNTAIESDPCDKCGTAIEIHDSWTAVTNVGIVCASCAFEFDNDED